MSYDLYFTEPEVTRDQFTGYFSDRHHYKVENDQAWYENEDTGVYFCFEYSNEPEEDPEAPRGNIGFNMNYFRPHYFALEAEPEVQNFISHFDFKILDQQTNGMKDGPYSRKGIITGWNHGNEAGYDAFLNSDEPIEVTHSRPHDELESIWNWNYSREQTQNKLGDGIFVPRIMFFQIDGKTRSVIVWPDAIPILIPTVDYIVIPRQELAPRGLFKKKDDICAVSFGEALHVLKDFGTEDSPINSYSLNYTAPPKHIVTFIKSLPSQKTEMQGISLDQILNQELVEKYKKS
jgi:hypothetical protein